MNRQWSICFYVLVVATHSMVCLRLLGLDIPSFVRQGEDVWLNCTLDLESDELYSVKWYKNDVEFYRYLPRDSPRGQKYDLPGVDLDLRRSVQGNVYLLKADLSTEGLYRCEASAESPTFQTVEGEKMVQVYVLPKEDPRIIGSQPRYDVGDVVNVTCRSEPSKPAAILKWYINGKEAELGLERKYPLEEHHNGLKTTTLGLRFVVRPTDLHQGAITLKCLAVVSQTYSTSSEELVASDRYPDPSPFPNNHNMLPRDGPVIAGGKTHYRVGDLLDVNCSSNHNQPQLHWFLNDKEVGSEHLLRYKGHKGPVVGLRMRVRTDHMDENEELRLKCTATLSRELNTRSRETTLGGHHRTSAGLTVAENFGKISERSSTSTKDNSSSSKGCVSTGLSQVAALCTGLLFLL